MRTSHLGALAFAIGVLATLGFARPAAAGPGLIAGAVEDELRASTLVEAEARMELMRLSGFRAVRVTSYWQPGVTRPTEGEVQVLQNVAQAADRNGIRLYVTVMHPGSRTTPLTSDARSDFASYAATIVREAPAVRHLIIANEPNLNRFWLPQFRTDGSSEAPAAYLALLAQAYDAVKAVSPEVTVYGGAVAPRGTDRPNGIRPTHSPTTFIQGLGNAYRASGRTRPVMDVFVMHVYGNDSTIPPTRAYPLTTEIGVADYDKLVSLLGQAFDGTAQKGSTLPILYGEYGVETQIPDAKESLYTGSEPMTTKPVSETTQAQYYRDALALAYCQPNVIGMLLFPSRDERARAAWQSGLWYIDGTAKTSLPRVRESLERTMGGSIAKCPGIQLNVHTSYLRFGTRSAAKRGTFRVSFTCDLDCSYEVRLLRVPGGTTRVLRKGRAEVNALTRVDLGAIRPRPGAYRYTIRLVHPVNPGRPTLRRGPAFRLP
jgi:hypothetical protein